MADATMAPMPMVKESAAGEQSSGDALEANLHYLITAMFMASSYGLKTFRYESAADAYDAWTTSYGQTADDMNYWKYSAQL